MTARWKIVQVANSHIMSVHKDSSYIPQLLTIKHIQRAVHVCRQAMLVDGKTLMEAGFKPVHVKPGKPTVLKRLLGEG